MTLSADFVLAYLGEELAPALQADGYQWLPAKRQFRAKTDHGFRNLILSVAPYQDATLIEGHLGLRLDPIEDIVKRFTRTLPGFYPDAHSILVSEGKLIAQPYLRHHASDSDELDRVIGHLLDFWQKQGHPFLAKHDSLAAVDQLLNQHPMRPSPYLPNQAHRCLKGIVAARLVQRPDFEALAEQHEAALAQTPTGSLLMAGYRRLVGYLRQISLN
jgi:hypothetical protein